MKRLKTAALRGLIYVGICSALANFGRIAFEEKYWVFGMYLIFGICVTAYAYFLFDFSRSHKAQWQSFWYKRPTEEGGEQVEILFGSPNWATYMRGLYTHFPDQPLKDCLMYYDQVNDKYIQWESEAPNHWMLLPKHFEG